MRVLCTFNANLRFEIRANFFRHIMTGTSGAVHSEIVSV